MCRVGLKTDTELPKRRTVASGVQALHVSSTNLVVIDSDQLKALIAAAVREAMPPPRDPTGWLDQSETPLGKKRHCAAVRARIARSAAGAAVVGRRYLLSPEALAEEIAALKEPEERTARLRRNRPDVISEIERELEGA